MERTKLEDVVRRRVPIFVAGGHDAGRVLRAALAIWVLALGLVLGAAEGGYADDAAPRVDLNSASEAELTSLPGVGPAKAKAIIAYRETSPFESADELIEVKGIGDKLYAQLKDLVTVKKAGEGGDGAGGTTAAGPQARAARPSGGASAR